MTILYNILQFREVLILGNNNYKLSVRIERKDWETFKVKTDKIGLSASNVIRLFIKKFNENPDNIENLFD